FPRRVRRPTVGRRRFEIAGGKRRTEEVAGEEAQIRGQAFVAGDRRIIDPRRRVQRLDASTALLDLQRADLTCADVDDRTDPVSLDRVERRLCHDLSRTGRPFSALSIAACDRRSAARLPRAEWIGSLPVSIATSSAPIVPAKP